MDAIQILMQQATDMVSPFGETSRYRHIPLAKCSLVDGREVVYVRRRFLPQPEEMATLAEHVVKPRDRLDNLAHHYLGDPELFWQICDANRALRPADLTDDPPELGEPRRIRIALPPGMPAPPQA